MKDDAFIQKRQMNREIMQEQKDAMNTPMPNTGVNITGPVPPMDPFSNGTGSGRPNINPVDANNINQINQGNPMGQQLFGASKKNKTPLTTDMFFKPYYS